MQPAADGARRRARRRRASRAIEAAKRISFHAVGDTGAAKVRSSQTATKAIAHEASVADAMALRRREAAARPAPAFFFHLGDVIYNFGEAQYYYDQFYEPFRAYDRPIFAIPGNHDGMVFGDDPTTPQVPTLARVPAQLLRGERQARRRTRARSCAAR